MRARTPLQTRLMMQRDTLRYMSTIVDNLAYEYLSPFSLWLEERAHYMSTIVDNLAYEYLSPFSLCLWLEERANLSLQ